MEKTAAPKAQWILPLQDRPFAVFKNILDETNHVGRSERRGKHFSNGAPALHWRFRDLVIDGVIGVERRQAVQIGAVECLDPKPNEIAGLHRNPIGFQSSIGSTPSCLSRLTLSFMVLIASGECPCQSLISPVTRS